MERFIDKSIIAICCLAMFSMVSPSPFTIGGYLVALSIAALCEVVTKSVARILAFVFMAAALVYPDLLAFLPLIAYDCIHDELTPVRVAWPIPLLAGLRAWDVLPWGLVVLFCLVAVLLSWRNTKFESERERSLLIRDKARETSLSLEERNRDLLEARDLSARVATLAERGRIAREIHDNVGHLLTRAIMQTEALKVVHASESNTVDELDAVAKTLNEAMQTVRVSVHDLRDEAIAPEKLMRTALEGCGLADTQLSYEAHQLPDDVARCFVSIVREAATNTVRHSDATSIHVDVHEYEGLYQLVVQDNGTREEETSSADYGMGLQTMEDRTRALGGVLRTGWKEGFRVIASIPKSSPSASERSAHAPEQLSHKEE